MRFFFADSQDLINPSFDFASEEHGVFRLRQRDDRYPHEVLSNSPYEGLLVSKSIVDGTSNSSGRYTVAQRNRLRRLGVRRFFRIHEGANAFLSTMGDCGAFSYVNETEPPYSVTEVLDFYEECGFDLGISVDHVILGMGADDKSLEGDPRLEGWRQRQELTLALAGEFLRLHHRRRSTFIPIGVAQGWSPSSYAYSTNVLQDLGYDRIALGGMVPLKTQEIVKTLRAVADVRHDSTQLHLLGVTRCDHLEEFASYGVTSFDTTSPLRQAFKDDDDNYYWFGRNFTALRVPQVDGNTRLRLRIRSGEIDQRAARAAEGECLQSLREFDRGDVDVEDVVVALRRYSAIMLQPRDRSDDYRAFLSAAPWRQCTCGLCEKDGIDVAIFRGAERNRRRGFHNLHMFRRLMEQQLADAAVGQTA